MARILCAAWNGVKTAAAIYTTATLQNPTSAVMSPKRRRAIAALATYSDHAYYLIGTSKPLLPSFRVGFLRAPLPMIDRLSAAIAATVYMTSPIAAELVTDWLADGVGQRVMQWKRDQLAARQAMVRRILADADYQAHPQSPHGWLRLSEQWSARDFVQQAAQRGVYLSPADEFCVGCRSAPHAVRIWRRSDAEQSGAGRRDRDTCRHVAGWAGGGGIGGVGVTGLESLRTWSPAVSGHRPPRVGRRDRQTANRPAGHHTEP